MADVPAGFHRLDRMDDVMGGFDPVYIRREADGHVTLGFHVGQQHCNPRGHCHGGTWATMADVVMGVNVGFVTGLSGPTVSMSIDFLSAAAEGQWVEGRAEVLRWTPNLGFAQCHFSADGEVALRANAVFRRKFPPHRDFESLIARSSEQNG
ncbi:PaaI family thioesterase [Sphingobium sp. PNB]|uniref:PaaI family thioesterase n=1 Tax=Sphingobium sp. PNB TaxID=863934 RepID=UPI001CA3F018|nr:PaaI family thioesterase [Sphingobium sp. PNB]MCB4858797.1 PaaI family thioesterase [Sphingobium sp. PNB]